MEFLDEESVDGLVCMSCLVLGFYYFCDLCILILFFENFVWYDLDFVVYMYLRFLNNFVI